MQVDTCVDQAVVEVYGQVVNSTPNSTYEMPNTSTNKPLPHWAKGLNVVMSNLLLKMKKRNFKENDVSMILQEFEKMLHMTLVNFIETEEIEVAMELAFSNFETKYFRDQWIKVLIIFV